MYMYIRGVCEKYGTALRMNFGVVQGVELAAVEVVQDDSVVERRFGIHPDYAWRKGAVSGGNK
jgi:hypothetical protein